MIFSKTELHNLIENWLLAWNSHNLPAVMELIHDEVVFENWTGEKIAGKKSLLRSWNPWFMKHGNFNFATEDIFVDESEQKVLLQWQLTWPSLESKYKGTQEVRRGVDVIHFMDGKIFRKDTYSKTTISIDSSPISLHAS